MNKVSVPISSLFMDGCSECSNKALYIYDLSGLGKGDYPLCHKCDSNWRNGVEVGNVTRRLSDNIFSAEEFLDMLNHIGSLTPDLELIAGESNLIIIYAKTSDRHVVNVSGIFSETFIGSGSLYVSMSEIMDDSHSEDFCNCEHCGYELKISTYVRVELRPKDGDKFAFKVGVPSLRFTLGSEENTSVYGIILEMKHLPSIGLFS